MNTVRIKIPVGIILLALCMFCSAEEENEELEVIELPPVTTYVSSSVTEQRVALNEEEIELKQTEDLASVLQSLGIQILSYGPYGLEQKPSLRGFTDETVRVVIDGVCVNNAQYGTFDFSSIDLSDVEKIEVVRGGFTEDVSDEGAVGGVIYITTKKACLGTEMSFDVRSKTFFNTNMPFDSAGAKINISSQTADSSFLKINTAFACAENKFLYRKGSSTAERLNSEVLDLHTDISFTEYFGNASSFSFGDMFYFGNKNIPGAVTEIKYGKQKDFDSNLYASLNVPSLAEGIKMYATASWLCNNRFFYEDYGKSLNAENENSEHYVNTFKISTLFDFCRFEKINESAGITLDYTLLDSTDDGKINVFSGTVKETTKINFNKTFSMTVPVAFKFTDFNFAFTPKIGFKINLSYGEWLFNVYRMTQFPNLDDLYWNSSGFKGNPDLKPEDGWGAELCFNCSKNIFPVSICLFTNYYENKIQWGYRQNVWSVYNIASAFYFGTDINFKKKFADGKIIFCADAEYLYTRLLNKENAVTYGKKIMWTPDFTGSISVTANISGLSHIVEVNYVGKRYKSNINVSFLKPYVLVNYALTFSKGIKMGKKSLLVPYFRADNILDVSYESVDGYPMPGISLSLGAKLK